MKNEMSRISMDDQMVLSFASPEAILSQLSLVRADLVRNPLSVCHIETNSYCSGEAEDIDRLMRDIRAGRVEEFRIDESRWGARRIILNYFCR